jgi:hypothetical protein
MSQETKVEAVLRAAAAFEPDSQMPEGLEARALKRRRPRVRWHLAAPSLGLAGAAAVGLLTVRTQTPIAPPTSVFLGSGYPQASPFPLQTAAATVEEQTVPEPVSAAKEAAAPRPAEAPSKIAWRPWPQSSGRRRRAPRPIPPALLARSEDQPPARSSERVVYALDDPSVVVPIVITRPSSDGMGVELVPAAVSLDRNSLSTVEYIP